MVMIFSRLFAGSSGAFRATPARKQPILVCFLEGVRATRAMLRMKRMVTKTCPIRDAIILHYQSVHVSTSCIILVIFDAQENFNA